MITSDSDEVGNDDFVRRLIMAHSSRTQELAAARRWHPGDVNGDLLALIGPTSPQHYSSFATTAKLFAVWHQGRPSAVEGFPDHGIGRWAHQLGVGDLKVLRLFGRIINANEDNSLVIGLTALAARRSRCSPHWLTVLDELLRWSDPSARLAVRLDWASDFYRYRPNPSLPALTAPYRAKETA